jgi:hypothetical protein
MCCVTCSFKMDNDHDMSLYLFQKTLEFTQDTNKKMISLALAVEKLQQKADMSLIPPVHLEVQKALERLLRFDQPTASVDAFFACKELQTVMADYMAQKIVICYSDVDGHFVHPANSSWDHSVVSQILLRTFTVHYLGHSAWGEDAK